MPGKAGASFYALCVVAGCFGVTNAATFTSARLIYTSAKQHHLPSIFGVLHPKILSTVYALMLHGALSSTMTLMGDLTSLLMFNGIMECGWYFVSFSLGNIFDLDNGIGTPVTEKKGAKFEQVFINYVMLTRGHTKFWIIAPITFCSATLTIGTLMRIYKMGGTFHHPFLEPSIPEKLYHHYNVRPSNYEDCRTNIRSKT